MKDRTHTLKFFELLEIDFGHYFSCSLLLEDVAWNVDEFVPCGMVGKGGNLLGLAT